MGEICHFVNPDVQEGETQCHALINVPGYGGCLPRARHRQEHRRRHLEGCQEQELKMENELSRVCVAF